MDIIDRLLAHDAWTTRQLLLACQALPDASLDLEFEIDHRSLRKTFAHMIGNLEVWTDLISERPVVRKSGDSIPELIARLDLASREFSEIARRIVRQQRADDYFTDTLDEPATQKTFGGAIGHVITHNMHHRAQVMFLMEKVGLKEHIEGDLLSWESMAFKYQ
jgi:uncharacterized damage-inducible protein DinB